MFMQFFVLAPPPFFESCIWPWAMHDGEYSLERFCINSIYLCISSVVFVVTANLFFFLFAERRLLLAAEPFAIMCAYLISTDLYRGRHVPVCREPVHVRGKSARLFYRPETI